MAAAGIPAPVWSTTTRCSCARLAFCAKSGAAIDKREETEKNTFIVWAV